MEALVLGAVLIVVSLIVLLWFYLNSFSRRRRIGALKTSAMLDVALDDEASLYYRDVSFVCSGRQYSLDHLVITESSVFALSSIDISGENSITAESGLRRHLFGFLPVDSGNPLEELDVAVQALSSKLGFTKHEHSRIHKIVSLTGSGEIREGGAGSVIYIEELIMGIMRLASNDFEATLTPERVREKVIPVLGAPSKGELNGIEKLRYEEAQRIASEAKLSGFGANGYPEKVSGLSKCINWLKENF